MIPLLVLLLTILAPNMTLKAGAVVVEDRGYEVVKTKRVDLYTPEPEPEIRIPIVLAPGTPIMVCVVSRSNGKPGGWQAWYGDEGTVVRKYRGQNYHTRCAALVTSPVFNHYLMLRSTGMIGRRDYVRRVTISQLVGP